MTDSAQCTYKLTDEEANLWTCSACGADWQLTAGNPVENEMRYCPGCGKRIVEIVFDAEVEE